LKNALVLIKSKGWVIVHDTIFAIKVDVVEITAIAFNLSICETFPDISYSYKYINSFLKKLYIG
jgi:hypothetical protein